jgi:hypothetical protein
MTMSERMGRADGCPEACGNVEPPTACDDAPGGFVAYYKCSHCGHVWWTRWAD